MNISEQLNLLNSIKEDIKTKLIEIGVKITDLTPFKEYSRYILKPEKSAIIDSIIANNQPVKIKEKISKTNTDSVTYEKYLG